MEITLLDLPSGKIYIELGETFHKRLFDKAISTTDSRSKLAEALNSNIVQFSLADTRKFVYE
jgi:hypothetical protein